MKNIVSNLKVVPVGLAFIALSSCSGSSASYERSNAKYLSALQSVLTTLQSAPTKSQRINLGRLSKIDIKPNPSLAKAAQDALSLSYCFFNVDGVFKKDLSLAYSSNATIGETKLGIVTRCRYTEDTSNLGVYFTLDMNDERSCFYLDGIYDDGKKEMTTYSFYACNGDNQVNQYLEKNEEGFISVVERSEEISKYDVVAQGFNDYLNQLSPTYVDGALAEAYNDMDTGGDTSEEPSGSFTVSVAGSMVLKAYGFDGKETTDFLHPLLVSCEKDITKEGLFNGEVFHTYASLPDGGQIDVTDQSLSSTAFLYVRVENKNPIELSLETHNGSIAAEGIKWARFYDDNLVSPPRGETICIVPPDWHEMEPYRVSSERKTLYDPSAVKEFVIWFDGNYIDEVPDVTLSFA